jgi:hypothetical protein
MKFYFHIKMCPPCADFHETHKYVKALCIYLFYIILFILEGKRVKYEYKYTYATKRSMLFILPVVVKLSVNRYIMGIDIQFHRNRAINVKIAS